MKPLILLATTLLSLEAFAVDTEKIINLSRLSTTHTTMKLVDDLAKARSVKSPFTARELTEMQEEAREAADELKGVLEAIRAQGPRDCYHAAEALSRHARGDGLAYGLVTADFMSQGKVLQDASVLVKHMRAASQESVDVLAAKIKERCK